MLIQFLSGFFGSLIGALAIYPFLKTKEKIVKVHEFIKEAEIEEKKARVIRNLDRQTYEIEMKEGTHGNS